MTSSKIRWFGQLCDAKKISYHFKNPLPAASFWKKNNPDPCLKMFWTRFIAIRSASPTQTMIINQTIELSEDECFWHRKSHRICDSFMFINFAFSKKMFCWRKKNDISIALFYWWLKLTYYNFSESFTTLGFIFWNNSIISFKEKSWLYDLFHMWQVIKKKMKNVWASI